MSPSRAEASRRLHVEVRRFAERSLEADLSVGEREREFEALACALAQHQTGEVYGSLDEVVRHAVVSDAFRFDRVFAFEPGDAELRFVTSGTSGANTGVHYMRERSTYEQLSLAWGKRGLGFGDGEPVPIVVALAPFTGSSTGSSLGYMMQRFMEHFDGRSLTAQRDRDRFVLDAPERWLVSGAGVNLDGLRRVRELALEVGCRVTLLATSFALVELLDAANGETFVLPPGSVVMPTGGFKGRTRTIEPAAMHAELYRLFGDIDLVGEYGMTELTSQLYEGTARAGALRDEPGSYLAPPWLRVVALDPTTLEPVGRGEVGLACFIDLGNVDSAVTLLTQDLVRVDVSASRGSDAQLGGDRVQLLGRWPKAPLRGCSLAVEALLRKDQRTQSAGPDEHEVTMPPSVDAHPGETDAAALRRVNALVAGAARLASEIDQAEVSKLAASSGLSPEGVRLALDLSLESAASADEMAELIRTARREYGVESRTAWVLLSSNVFTAPLRAVALAAAVSSKVKVRPSRREPRFARLLHEACPDVFELVTELSPLPNDVVLAYGSDETLATVRAALPSGVHFFGHGHGMGVAVVGVDVDHESAASALALDVVLFDQQGCASPRLVLIDAASDVDGFVTALATSLAEWEQRVPLGRSDATLAHERAWCERLARRCGRVTAADTGWVAHYDTSWAHAHDVPIAPAGRCLSVVSTRDVTSDLRALRQLVTSVGIAGDKALVDSVRACLPSARITALGSMQRPPFDGPVDRRQLTA